MTGQVYNVTVGQIESIVSGLDAPQNDKAALLLYARVSSPLCAGYVGDELVCLMGTVPTTLLSRRAYIWLYETAAIAKYKISFVRLAKQFVKNLSLQYDVLNGHCHNDRGKHWLESLGAEFNTVSGALTSFEIKVR